MNTDKPALGWVLVTGGSRGIGKGVVEDLCRRGYDVVFTYHSVSALAASVAAALQSEGGRCEAIECDGRDEMLVEATVQQLLSRKGPPYALINNMGVCRDVALLNMSPARWREVLDTNLSSAFLFCRYLTPGMISRREGVILQIASVSGLKGIIGQTHYSASKAGMMGFTRSLALELARFNIRVNAVAPGYIETDMLGELPPARRESLARQVPLRRVGQVQDVSALCGFLLSDQSNYITGQTLVVDGGLCA